MSTNTSTAKASTAKAQTLTPGQVYRIALRAKAVQLGWTFSQLSTSNTDSFTKGEVTIHVHHSAADILTGGQVTDGKALDSLKGTGKWEQAQAKLSGSKWNGKRVVLSKADRAALAAAHPLGKGLGLIKGTAAKAPKVSTPKVTAVTAAKVSTPKAAPKASTAKVVAPKATGPTNADRQAAKDAQHVQDM